MEKEKRKNSQMSMAEELSLPMNDAERKEIDDTFDEWMERARRLDGMMSKPEFSMILPSNTFLFR